MLAREWEADPSSREGGIRDDGGHLEHREESCGESKEINLLK